jgi:hypothetical protein
VTREADMRHTSRTFTKIMINGRTYTSVEEMPPDVRRQYEETMAKLSVDKNNNGIPDFAEQPGGNAVVTYTQHDITSAEDLPPEAKAAIADFMSNRMPAGLDRSPGTVSYQSPMIRVPSVQSGFTVHFTWAMLVAMAAIVAIVCAVAWWVVTR